MGFFDASTTKAYHKNRDRYGLTAAAEATLTHFAEFSAMLLRRKEEMFPSFYP